MTTRDDRRTPIDLSSSEFRMLGHRLVDEIAELLDSLPSRPVTTGQGPSEVRALIGGDSPLPENGSNARDVVERAARIVIDNSLYNAHPRFWGYITAGAAPIGVLADLLASAVNPNVGGWVLSPIASEIEQQTIRWLADLIGYPQDCGGLLVSGGNMANFVGFLAARAAKADGDLRNKGIASGANARLRVYCSAETHTWVQKACDMFGLGTEATRWIPADAQFRMDPVALRTRIVSDREAGDRPFLVIGTAGSVSTGGHP